MKEIEALKESSLIVHQGASQTGDLALLSTQVRSGILEDLYVKNQEVIENKDARILLLENELLKYKLGDFSFKDISRELKVNYENVETLGFANMISTNFAKIDTIPTFSISWKNNVVNRVKKDETRKIRNWLTLRLKLDTLAVKSVN